MTQPEESSELETAVVAVYRGPLEEFISRRDALAKELRAAKRREDADRVKALRKPSRTAWVLDNIVHEDPSVLDQLTAAIGAAQTVHSGADLRAALDNVRTAIRDVAAAGARVAIRAGQPIDASALVTAVHAVIGETSAFNDLRAGRLVEVPAGGGLDILSAITISVPSPPSVAPSQPIAAPIPAPPNAAPSAESARQAEQRAERAIAAARADLQRAEASLATAREQSERAAQSVRETQATHDAAEQALSHAQSEAQARRIDVDRARRDAETAATQVREAERAVAAARARVPDSSGT
jgi:hypothetical protein